MWGHADGVVENVLRRDLGPYVWHKSIYYYYCNDNDDDYYYTVFDEMGSRNVKPEMGCRSNNNENA